DVARLPTGSAGSARHQATRPRAAWPSRRATAARSTPAAPPPARPYRRPRPPARPPPEGFRPRPGRKPSAPRPRAPCPTDSLRRFLHRRLATPGLQLLDLRIVPAPGDGVAVGEHALDRVVHDLLRQIGDQSG